MIRAQGRLRPTIYSLPSSLLARKRKQLPLNPSDGLWSFEPRKFMQYRGLLEREGYIPEQIGSCLVQQISLAMQRGSAASVLCTWILCEG